MMRKPDYAFWAFVTLAGMAGMTTVLNVTRTHSATTSNSEIYKQLDLFGDVLERVRSDYVEKPDDAMLIDSAINGMLTALDPHSAYLNPKHFRDMQVQTRGEFGGLGIEVTMEQGVVKVVSPIDDTPAAKAGVQANDLITHLDGEQIVGLTLEQAVEKMRGPVNTAITLTVIRKGRSDPFDIKIVRDVIRINAVKARAEGDIIYVKVTTFNEQTHANLVKSIETLKKQIGPSVRGYIIDLRNNPGGLLEQAIHVADDFLDRGAIVLTKGRNLEETQRANARAGDFTDGKPVFVLINGGSASASEIVAGALQDHKRAIIIGTRSFGKGSVQTIIPLGQNGAIRLTTARYYTPSGRSIQATGIVPDITIEQPLPDDLKGKGAERPRGEASLRGHLRNPDAKDKKEESGSSAYVPREAENDVQLQFALKFMRGEVPDPRTAAAPAPDAAPTTTPATPETPEKKDDAAPASPDTPAPAPSDKK
jgi:carboxyl-terminal processing protease